MSDDVTVSMTNVGRIALDVFVTTKMDINSTDVLVRRILDTVLEILLSDEAADAALRVAPSDIPHDHMSDEEFFRAYAKAQTLAAFEAAFAEGGER